VTSDKNFEFKIHFQKDQNLVYVFFKKSIGGKSLLYNFVDIPGDNLEDLTSFTRIIDTKKLYIKNGVVIFNQESIKTEFIKTLKKQQKPNFKNITLDIETREKNNQHEPICISIFDSKILKTFKLRDDNNSEDMIKAAINTILNKKYSGYKVYIHNFSYFDSIFLLKYIINQPDVNVKPLIRDGRMLKLNVQMGKLPKPTKSGALYK
jgi:hypothetical protein